MKPRFHLDVTGVCNLACSHCYQDDHVGRPLALEDVDRILAMFDRMRRHHGDRGEGFLTLGGGEPTTHPDLAEVIKLAKRYNFTSRLVTNATLIDLPRAWALRRAGLKMVQVSLDGATRETHEAIRGPRSWDRAIAGISALRKARMVVILNAVMIPGHNLGEIPRLLDLSRQLGVWGIKVQRVVPRGHAARGLVTRGDFHQTLVALLERAVSIRYRRLIMLFDPLAHNLPNLYPELTRRLWFLSTDMCHCDRTELVEVDVDGAISYCRVGQKLGNVWEDDLIDVWANHPLLGAIRERGPRGACGSCAAWSGCRGGCPAVTHGLLQDASAPDLACPAWSEA